MITINDGQYEYNDGLTVEKAFELAFGSVLPDYLASVNGTFILRTKWDSTPVSDGDELMFIHIAGGG